MDVRIGEVVTDIAVTESVGPLSAADVKRISEQVLEHVRQAQTQQEQRQRDTGIHDRAYMPDR